MPYDWTALAALKRIREHLADDGAASIPLFIPGPDEHLRVGQPREYRTAEGEIMRVTATGREHDERSRCQTTVLRYESEKPGGTIETVEQPWVLQWYTRTGFTQLASQAGLEVIALLGSNGEPASSDATSYEVIAWKPAE